MITVSFLNGKTDSVTPVLTAEDMAFYTRLFGFMDNCWFTAAADLDGELVFRDGEGVYQRVQDFPVGSFNSREWYVLQAEYSERITASKKLSAQ